MVHTLTFSRIVRPTCLSIPPVLDFPFPFLPFLCSEVCQETPRRVEGARGRWGASNGCQRAEREAMEGMGGERMVCVHGRWGGRGGFRLKPDD